MKKHLLLTAGIAAMLVLSACGNAAKTSEPEAQAASHYPVTIENFTKAEGGTTWEKKEQVFDKAPERIMANTRPAAELLLHLGLGDKIAGVGANFGAPDPAVESEYNKLNILSDEYVGKEVTLGTNPDLVYGRGGLFDNADWGVGTVDTLNGMGIKTYVLESSVTGGTYDSIYKDIEHLGEIFNVQDKAESFIQELKGKQEGIASKLAGIQAEKTFAYLHMSDPKEVSVYAAQQETFFNDAFKMVKLDNVFKNETGEVSVEMLIQADPDVLIIPDWSTTGGTTQDKLKEALYANPKLSSMKAIKNKQIYAVDYNYMFGYGYNTIDGMEKLAKEMYPDLFK
ncbi:ABC transporter substrate-binding protein [Paenibacillus sp. AR247]|uniref:ABC transporter substrate-binding protein n=1 Tax=Paenibacillus sp. AR247 TaxID=1631599 RepID=UPI000CFA0B91|nr:ABC transporter substrate-binding protein [Paenibacillus sp. AR247]PQP88815.1 ABC transporter [Paenibacillus sp. AR247]